MKVCKKPFIWYLVAILVFSLGFTWYSRWSHIKEVSAVNVIRKVIPGGPVFWMAHEGNYVAGVGPAENDYDETALYLYDTNGTWADLSDDTYSIIDQVEGGISHITFQGNHITWLDTTGFFSCSAMSLKAYNITTSSTIIISNQIADYVYGRDGNKIVYQYVVPNSRDIALYDLSTQQTTIICNASGFQRNPRIKNNVIVWEDSRNPQTGIDIFMYHLTTQTETLVAEDVAEEGKMVFPETNGAYIIYNDYTANNLRRARKYNITTATTSTIASSSQNIRVFASKLNSQYCLWEETNDGTSQESLYLHNLATSQNTLVNVTNLHLSYDMNESHLVFIELANQEVSGFNLSTQQLYSIRTVGETRTIYLNPTTNTMLMCSKGTGMDPDEWDISYASIP
jgi:beta propeller repeat protein